MACTSTPKCANRSLDCRRSARVRAIDANDTSYHQEVVTHELRWFVAQPISDDELRAFASNRTIERRCDSYLRNTTEQRGVKQRGGAALEDKRRLASFALRLEVDGRTVHGAVERWHKRWPRELELETELDHGEWLEVHKRRALLVREACRVELTGLHVEINGSSTTEFQTFAFETLTPDDPLDTLACCAKTVLHEYPELLVRIFGQPSVGYPAWLGSLSR